MSVMAKRRTPPRFSTRRPAVAQLTRHQLNVDTRAKRRAAAKAIGGSSRLPTWGWSLVAIAASIACVVLWIAVFGAHGLRPGAY